MEKILVCKLNKRTKIRPNDFTSVFFIESSSKLIWKPCMQTFGPAVISKCLRIRVLDFLPKTSPKCSGLKHVHPCRLCFFFQMKYIYFSYKTVHTHNTVYKMIMIIHHCCSFVVFVIFVIFVVVLSIGTCTSRLNMNSHGNLL
jgi:hypothetical protein